MTKYFKVVTKCGHVGRQHYVPVAFAVQAENGKEAAKIARFLPRVKHDHKDAILSCVEVSYEDFLELNRINNEDAYLKCSSRQEQNQIDLSDRLFDDNHYDETKNRFRHIPTKEDKLIRKARIEYKKKREENQFSSRRLAGAF